MADRTNSDQATAPKSEVLAKASANLKAVLQESYCEDKQSQQLLKASKAYGDFSKSTF